MKVFVTGASGFIGSAIVQELLAAGHAVTGLARSDASAARIEAAGAKAHRGSLEDLDSLREGAGAADGVIHTAFIHDFSDMPAAGAADKRAIEAIGEALSDSGKPLVVTSGTAHVAAGHVATEEQAPDPTGSIRHRIASEEATLLLAARGVRSSLVRLPPSVNGKGDHAFVPALIRLAREKNVSAYVGEGANRWPAVHRLDAARLFRLALERGKPGARYHGVGDEGVPVREIAQVIARRLNLPLMAKSAQDAPAHFGWLAHFVAVDCPASSARTRSQLDWQPRQPGLIADLDDAHYFAG